MTGRELLVKLTALPEDQLDLLVCVEGCDCYGDAEDVEVAPFYETNDALEEVSKSQIIITRGSDHSQGDPF